MTRIHVDHARPGPALKAPAPIRYPHVSRLLDATINAREAASNPLWRAVLGVLKGALEMLNLIPVMYRNGGQA